ncbi:MAG: hypothetical protein KatS3mg003_1512 [Candidatus Nitrosocaldaceae archaeon]|nr:MAG: hypothetical protein KatS3mg003_1512 [Candidatus Nitrosocaldaceae archaeon]
MTNHLNKMILAYNIDERLIKRGEILLSLDFVDNYEQELALMN